MNGEQWHAAALEDHAAWEMYENDERSVDSYPCQDRTVKIILTLLAAVCGLLGIFWCAFLLLALALAIPLVIVCVQGGSSGAASVPGKVKVGESIFSGAAEAYFGEFQYVNGWIDEDQPIRLWYSQRIRSCWKGKEFSIGQALREHVTEDETVRLFYGMVLEIIVDPRLSRRLAAKVEELKSRHGPECAGLRFVSSAESEQVFTQEWMKQLYEGSGASMVDVSVRTGENCTRLLRIEFEGVNWNWREWKGLSYQVFVSRVARNMGMLQRLLDTICSNRALFGEQE